MKIAAFILGILIIVSSCKKSANGDAAGSSNNLPVIDISNVSFNREDSSMIFRFNVSLSSSSSQAVSVNYNTVAGTAVAGQDFIPVSGSLTFPAGQTQAHVDVTVTGDSLRRNDQEFYLRFSNPKNAVLPDSEATGTIVNSDLLYLPTSDSGYTTPDNYPGYHLVWNDEFNEDSLNTNEWNYETGGNGWGNNELENYTSRTQNLFLSDGNLIIEARKENYNGNQYTSARITTQGKEEFQYGRIDIRAKLPVASGMWPALWMLGSDINNVPWPGCGETDIMELIGKNPMQVVGSLHWLLQNGSEGTYNNVYNLPSGDFSQAFHVFSLVWAKDSVEFLVDDHPYVNATSANVSSGNYPFNSPFFFIFNVAVGGDWPGSPDAATIFPQRMFVDYVRVFQKN